MQFYRSDEKSELDVYNRDIFWAMVLGALMAIMLFAVSFAVSYLMVSAIRERRNLECDLNSKNLKSHV